LWGEEGVLNSFCKYYFTFVVLIKRLTTQMTMSAMLDILTTNTIIILTLLYPLNLKGAKFKNKVFAVLHRDVNCHKTI
jgi:high-affinity K+ transport system ATPase subunit B